MGNFFLGLDTDLFSLLNRLPHNWVFNTFFSLLSGIGSWGIVWFIILAVLFLVEEIEDKKCFFSFILAIVLSLFICEFLIKNIVQRPRPSYILNNVIEAGDTQRDFSFPSFHTTVSFAAAYVLALHHKKLMLPYFFLAALIAFSRIYLGKHFPGDIIGGIILGLSIGYISDLVINKLTVRLKLNKRKVKR